MKSEGCLCCVVGIMFFGVGCAGYDAGQWLGVVVYVGIVVGCMGFLMLLGYLAEFISNRYYPSNYTGGSGQTHSYGMCGNMDRCAGPCDDCGYNPDSPYYLGR